MLFIMCQKEAHSSVDVPESWLGLSTGSENLTYSWVSASYEKMFLRFIDWGYLVSYESRKLFI